jgi:hypothetical protein
MKACARFANINAVVDNGTLAIWPKRGMRSGSTVIVAPPPVGNMIGYPNLTANGSMLRNVFDPSIIYGGSIQVQSSIIASATYAVLGLDHDLECMVPKDKWESTIQAYNANAPVPIAPTEAEPASARGYLV